MARWLTDRDAGRLEKMLRWFEIERHLTGEGDVYDTGGIFDEGLGGSLAVIQDTAGDPGGTEYAGDTGVTVEIDGETVDVPVNCVTIKLAEETGWHDSLSVAAVSGAVKQMATVPGLGGANAYFRVPALEAGKVIRVNWVGDHWQEDGTIFDSWSDECAA